MGALDDGVRDDAVDSEAGEQHGQDGETAEEERNGGRLGEGIGDVLIESFHVIERQAFVERRDLAAGIGNDRARIVRGARGNKHGGERTLGERDVDFGSGFRAEAALLHIGDDTNDFAHGQIVGAASDAGADVLADWILVGEESPGECAVDDCDQVGFRAVVQGEVASREESYADGREITWLDGVEIGRGPGAQWSWFPLNFNT